MQAIAISHFRVVSVGNDLERWKWLKGTRPVSFTFGYLLLFLPLPNGRDDPSRLEYEESDVPGWRRLCEENENPAMVLAREFSISDSANPFYLKLRNSIPPAAPCPFEARRNSPLRLFYPAGYSLPSPVFVGHLRFSRSGGEMDVFIFSGGQWQRPLYRQPGFSAPAILDSKS